MLKACWPICNSTPLLHALWMQNLGLQQGVLTGENRDFFYSKKFIFI